MLAVIKFAKCKEGAKIPTRKEGSAGLDVYACFEEEYIKIEPHKSKLIPTGIKSAIDPNFFVMIEERGSTGVKGMKKSAGVIDPDFRGEWWICIYNSNDKPLFISKINSEEIYKELLKEYPSQNLEESIIVYPYEKAIAQAMILPVPDLDVEEWTEEEIMSVPSLRGEGQLGSSGK